MIHAEDRHVKIIKEILSHFPYEMYAFGSRVTGNPRKFSDLDLCYKQEIPAHVLVEIEEAFENSNLPFKVELISWKRCDEDFKSRIERDFIKLT